MNNHEFNPHISQDAPRSRPLNADEVDYYNQNASNEWQAVMDANCGRDPELKNFMDPIIQKARTMDEQTALDYKTICYRMYFWSHEIKSSDILEGR